MVTIDPQVLWRQFGSAIDMLDSALRDCPAELWDAHLWKDPSAQAGFSSFWYLGYHTLFWLDLYLTGSFEDFAPPAPFTLDELDPAGVLPPRVYTREELLGYLNGCRRKCQDTLAALSNEQADRLCKFPWGELPFVELQLDNMRHVQEHGAQLRMFLGQQLGAHAPWFARPRQDSDSQVG